MIKGINGQTYIDLDKELDISFLEKNIEKIYYSIARSKRIQRDYSVENVHDKTTFIINKSKRKYSQVSNEKKIFDSTFDEQLFYFLIFGDGNLCEMCYLRESNTIPTTLGTINERHLSSSNKWTSNLNYFDYMIPFIKELPFKELGRILFFINYKDTKTPIHSDDGNAFSFDINHINPLNTQPHNREFIWFNLEKRKKFFLFDPIEKKKYFISSSSAFFNDSDYHGSEICNQFSVSLRIDGIFSDEFKTKLNLSSYL